MTVKAPNCITVFNARNDEFICCEWPRLFKKTKTGAIQEWFISVLGKESGRNPIDPHKIVTKFGQVDGAIQTAEDEIREGKNTGKKNETSVYEQAVNEAQARWEKQLKKGYVKSIEEAEAGAVDDIIQGGVAPMLAHSFDKHEAKINYPCYVQPKLDGARCVAIIEPDGQTSLWTRTRKPITSMPHIVSELYKLHSWNDRIVLDGELYSSKFKSNFEDLMALVRPEKPVEGHEEVEFHVFDIINDKPYIDRLSRLEALIPSNPRGGRCIRSVATFWINDKSQLMQSLNAFLELGYEGAIARNMQGMYVGTRSYDLQKIKIFQDDEFEVIDILEGRGKLAGHGIFSCIAHNGEIFQVKMEGDLSKLKEIWDNKSKYIGKKLTVKFQNLSAYGIPRFPVGKAIRED